MRSHRGMRKQVLEHGCAVLLVLASLSRSALHPMPVNLRASSCMSACATRMASTYLESTFVDELAHQAVAVQLTGAHAGRQARHGCLVRVDVIERESAVAETLQEDNGVHGSAKQAAHVALGALTVEPLVRESLLCSHAPLGIDVEKPGDEILGISRDVLPVGITKVDLALLDKAEERRATRAPKRRKPDEERVDDDPHCPEIDGKVIPAGMLAVNPTLEDFGSHVPGQGWASEKCTSRMLCTLRVPGCSAEFAEPLVPAQAHGNTKVGNFDISLGREKNVLRIQCSISTAEDLQGPGGEGSSPPA